MVSARCRGRGARVRLGPMKDARGLRGKLSVCRAVLRAGRVLTQTHTCTKGNLVECTQVEKRKLGWVTCHGAPTGEGAGPLSRGRKSGS